MTVSNDEDELLGYILQGDPKWRLPVKSIEKIYSKNAGGRYGIYSIGIDRFIYIDNYDPWTTLTTAKILSSKIPLVVFCIRNWVGELKTNEDNPLLYTISDADKKELFDVAKKNQNPVLMHLRGKESILKAGVAPDYIESDRKKMLADLYNYACYCQRVVYAVKFADAKWNADDQYFFSKVMDVNNDELISKDDRSKLSDMGIIWRIYKILYLSSTVEEAKSKIKAIWEEALFRDFRRTFYYIMEIE